jgi:hypothetical protein
MKLKKDLFWPLLFSGVLLLLSFALYFVYSRKFSLPSHFPHNEMDCYIFFGGMLIVAVWGAAILYRLQERVVRKLFAWIFVLSEMLLFLGFLKRISYDPTLSEYLWYAYYGPLLFMPVLWLGLVLSQFTRIRIKRFVLLVDIVSAILFLLVMTNHFHHWGWDEDQLHHNWLFFTVYGYLLLALLASFVSFFVGTLRLKNFKAAWPATGVLVLIVVYSLVYLLVLNGRRGRSIYVLNNAMLMFVLLGFALMEATLDAGLMQNSGFYRRYFDEGPYRLALSDASYHVLFQNKGFTMSEAIKTSVSTMAGTQRYSKTPMAGGYLLFQEDLSDLLALRRELMTQQKELERTNALLKKSQVAEAEIEKIKTRERLTDEVYSQIQKESALIEALADTLPDELTPENRETCLPTLKELKIRLCFLKQRCLFVINGTLDNQLSADDISLSIGSLSQDLKALGFTVAITYLSETSCSLPFALECNAFLFSLVEAFDGDVGALLGRVDGAHETFRFWVTPEGKFDPKKVMPLAHYEEEDGDHFFTLEKASS